MIAIYLRCAVLIQAVTRINSKICKIVKNEYRSG